MSDKKSKDQIVKEQIYRLFEFVRVESTITCDKCHIEHTVEHDNGYETFFSEGWRATERYCYCPACAKKFLKHK